MSSGGSNGTTTTSSLPGWIQPYAEGFLGQASNVAQQPYTPYTGQRVADLSPVQQSSIQGLANLAGGTNSMQAADQQLSQTLTGGYQNPYASQGVYGGGQYNFGAVKPGQNQYAGENPYFRESLQRGLSDIGDAYQRTTQADTTRLMNQAGVFGGGAHSRAVSNNQRDLADRMGGFTNSMLNQQFDRSAGLAESDIGRRMSADQFNVGQGASSFENAAQRGLQAGQFNASLGSQGWENERNRQLQAAGAATGLNAGFGQSYLNALNAGDIERRQQQSLLDSQRGDFDEWRGYPEHQLGVFGNALSSMLGGAGRTQTTEGPGADPVSQGLGLMMLGNGMSNKGGGGKSVYG